MILSISKFQRVISNIQNQPSISVLIKRCSKNMQQIYWRTPMPKRDFNKVASNFIEITSRHGCSPVNLVHIFRMPFPKNTSGGLLLNIIKEKKIFFNNALQELKLLRNDYSSRNYQCQRLLNFKQETTKYVYKLKVTYANVSAKLILVQLKTQPLTNLLPLFRSSLYQIDV